MREFFGSASVVINFSFELEAETIEEAEKVILNSESMCFGLIDKRNDRMICIDINSWHVADEVGVGNVMESDLQSFQIQEEK
ncbi:hypothetical protein SAMN02910355_1869 [Terrisporobacter glycolicus]|nr:hypothetical protein SAMN02910355_1869 [Terrisporobacter glycolicus]